MNIRYVILLAIIAVSLNLSAQLNVNELVNTLSNPADTVFNEKHNNSKTHYLNFSVGFFNPVDFAFSLANVKNANGNPSPSFNLDYNYAMNSSISIGAFANYYRVNAQYSPNISELETVLNQGLACTEDIDDITDIFDVIGCIGGQIDNELTIEERLNVFTFGGKLSAHKRLLPKIDTYAATYLGISFNHRENIVEKALEEFAGDLLSRSSVEIPKFMYFVNAGARYYLNQNIGIYGEFGYGNIHLARVGLTYRF